MVRPFLVVVIDCASFPLVTTFEQVLAALGELYTEPHEYRTVVIDSLDWLEQLIWAEVCRKRSVESIEDNNDGESGAVVIWY